MTLPPSFRHEYAEAATAFSQFIGHSQMERFHATHWRLKLDKALGMPWTLYRITPSVALRVSFSGAALNMRPDGLRFAPPSPARSVRDAQDFDNLARCEAVERFNGFKGVSWYARDLRDYMTGDLPIARDPNFVPAMITHVDLHAPTPTPEERARLDAERKEKWAAHVAAHKVRVAEREKEEAAMIAHINRHDPAAVSGAQAFYDDIRLHLREGLADPQMPDDFRAYYEWLVRYVDLRAAGKTDAEILPLRLDRAFPGLSPGPGAPAP